MLTLLAGWPHARAFSPKFLKHFAKHSRRGRGMEFAGAATVRIVFVAVVVLAVVVFAAVDVLAEAVVKIARPRPGLAQGPPRKVPQGVRISAKSFRVRLYGGLRRNPGALPLTPVSHPCALHSKPLRSTPPAVWNVPWAL